MAKRRAIGYSQRMEHEMILSASGWRKVFAKSGDENDDTAQIGETNSFVSLLAAQAFARFVRKRTGKKTPRVVVARDTRPTGEAIVGNALKALCVEGVRPVFLGVACAPEMMAAARKADGFLYVSASHNPIGHNGLKFGLSDGGVLCKEDAAALARSFEEECEGEGAEERALGIAIAAEQKCKASVEKAYADAKRNKERASGEYLRFVRTVITGDATRGGQQKLFRRIKAAVCQKPLCVVCDLNGSSRGTSIDAELLRDMGVELLTFNEDRITHSIIPEGENLVPLAQKIAQLQPAGERAAVLGFMPDCDGDRGNTVFYDGRAPRVIEAQEGFALCVLSELCYEIWRGEDAGKIAVVVNCATSMMVDDICRALGAKVFRAEVGEANVVSLARQKRTEGFNVRILGEGSNGGNITHPSAVRDPLATLAALLKLLTLRDVGGKAGLYHIWLERSGQGAAYKEDFTLEDALASLPRYATTGVTDPKAIMRLIPAAMKGIKARFKAAFLASWEGKREGLLDQAGITAFRCYTTNGTQEVADPASWDNGTGGLKLKLTDAAGKDVAFMWLRPSGTESVLRLMCDVKASDKWDAKALERELIDWERQLVLEAAQV